MGPAIPALCTIPQWQHLVIPDKHVSVTVLCLLKAANLVFMHCFQDFKSSLMKTRTEELKHSFVPIKELGRVGRYVFPSCEDKMRMSGKVTSPDVPDRCKDLLSARTALCLYCKVGSFLMPWV